MRIAVIGLTFLLMLSVASPSLAITFTVDSGGIWSDTGSRDVFGNFGASGLFHVQGANGPSQPGQIGAGLAPHLSQFASGRWGTGVGSLNATITVNGVPCPQAPPFPFGTGCGVSLDLFSTPFDMPGLFETFSTGPLPFTATGRLRMGDGTVFDLIGQGTMSAGQRCDLFCNSSERPPAMISFASYGFDAVQASVTVPEPSTLVLAAVGMALLLAGRRPSLAH